MEVERKFLLAELGTELGEPVTIRQGYVAVDGTVSVRLRDNGTERILTVKGGSGRARAEVECDLTSEDFDELWPLTQGRRLEKRRHRVPLDGGLTAEVDLYDGALAGLAVVEVEFRSEESCEAFTAPDWFGPEVTDDDRYSNAALATRGRPEPVR